MWFSLHFSIPCVKRACGRKSGMGGKGEGGGTEAVERKACQGQRLWHWCWFPAMGLRVASLAAVGAGNFTMQFKFSHCILSSCLSFPVLKWGWELLCRAVNEKQKKKSVKNVSRHTCVSFSLGHQFLVHKMTSHIRRHVRSTLWVCGLVLCFILQQVTHFTQESEFWSFLSLVTCLGNRQWWTWPFSVATQSSREQPMRGALCCWARVSSG